MNRMSGRALAMALSLTALGIGGSAFAAEEVPAPVAQAPASAIAVQLNGKDITFTDSVPQVVNERVFLPFRAVFEAMGAQVSNEGSTITAVRGDKTVMMMVDSTQVTVSENGVSNVLTMDVPPYVDENTWRTYVPVRFAAQAMGCSVGWDQDDQTAILVDTDKLIAAAVAENKYTYLDKYMEYSEQFQDGIWDMTADYSGTISMMGSEPLTMSGTVDGTVADNTQTAMNMNIKMDLKPFMDNMGQLSGETTELSDEEKAMVESLKKEGLDMDMRFDLASPVMYFTLSGKALEGMDMPNGAWYSMNLSDVYGQMGMDYKELLNISKSMDVPTLLKTALQGASFTDKDTSYDVASSIVSGVAATLSDDAFVKDGENRTTTYSVDQDGAAIDIAFSLQMKGDKVVGYGLVLSVAEEQTGVTMDVAIEMDEKNDMTATVKMDMATMMEMSMDMEGGYTEGTELPEITPPEDAVIIPLDQYLGA